jgi:hypothetical protein
MLFDVVAGKPCPLIDGLFVYTFGVVLEAGQLNPFQILLSLFPRNNMFF